MDEHTFEIKEYVKRINDRIKEIYKLREDYREKHRNDKE